MRIVRIYNSRMFLQIDQVDVRYAGQERPPVHRATLGLRAGEVGVLVAAMLVRQKAARSAQHQDENER